MKAREYMPLEYIQHVDFLMWQVIVPKESATLGFPGERASALNGNHLEIAKYSSRADNNFVRVSANIARIIHNISIPQQDITIQTV